LGSVLVVVKGLVLTVLAFGLMVFAHELGHFLAAKLFGVRVDRFSFGLGPKLVGRKWGQTEYMISAVPVGGYVKMAGGDEGEESTGAPDEFVSKPPGRRALIIAAGPLFSVLFGVPMFLAMYVVGLHVPIAKVQEVIIGSPAWDAGVRYGDRITRLDDRPVHTFDELQLAAIQSTPDKPLPLLVERAGRQVALTIVRPKASELGIFCSFQNTQVHRVVPDSPAEKAGLRRDDVILTVDGVMVRGWPDFRRRMLASAERQVTLGIERDGKPLSVNATPRARPSADPGFTIRLPSEVGIVRAGFPAEGRLEEGDRIVAVNGAEVTGWWDIEDAVAAGPPRVSLTLERAGEQTRVELDRGEGQRLTDTLGIAPRLAYVVDRVHGTTDPPVKAGDVVVKVGSQDLAAALREAGLYTPLDDVLPALAAAGRLTVRRGESEMEVGVTRHERSVGQLGIERTAATAVRKHSLLAAIGPAMRETAKAAQLVYVIIRKLASRDVKASAVAGPLGILQITYIHATRGWSDLFYLVGMITVNIGVLNLLPLPPLDGGRLVFLGYEKVRGRQPNRRIQEWVFLAGFALLLMVFVMATFNDVHRFFVRSFF